MMSSWGPAVVRNACKSWALLGFSLSAPRAVAEPTIGLNLLFPTPHAKGAVLCSGQPALGHVVSLQSRGSEELPSSLSRARCCCRHWYGGTL